MTTNKKNTKFAIFLWLLIFGTFLSSMHSVQSNNIIELFKLQAILNSLANKINDKHSVGLMGELLVGKTFKDIFTHEQLKNQTPKINSNDLVLLKYDQGQALYQLRTLQQRGTTCGIHSFRNCLWMIEGLSKNFNNFVESYLKILDETSFDKYLQLSSCSTYGSTPAQKKDIKSGKISCIQSNKCLPENSIKYLDQIFAFNYSPPENKKFVDDISERWSELYRTAQNALKKIEPLEDINAIACAAIIFYPWITRNEIMPFYDLIMRNSFCIGLDLVSNNGHMGHGTCLIAHKIKNNTEYLFLDSMNLPFNNGIYQYMPLISSLKTLIENPENFKNALIRKAYTQALVLASKSSPFQQIKIFSLNIFIDDQFNDLKLLSTKLYQTYKPHFCKLIKSYMAKDLENKRDYEEILQKMHCIA